MRAEPTWLYRFLDSDGRLLYVGITRNLQRRRARHAADKAWWPDVATTVVEWHASRYAALKAERVAIQTELPIHNVVHSKPCDEVAPWYTTLPDACLSCRRMMSPVCSLPDGEALYVCPCGNRWSCWWPVSGPAPKVLSEGVSLPEEGIRGSRSFEQPELNREAGGNVHGKLVDISPAHADRAVRAAERHALPDASSVQLVERAHSHAP